MLFFFSHTQVLGLDCLTILEMFSEDVVIKHASRMIFEAFLALIVQLVLGVFFFIFECFPRLVL
jgi:hypothetical protein